MKRKKYKIMLLIFDNPNDSRSYFFCNVFDRRLIGPTHSKIPLFQVTVYKLR